jgi:competence CoiA-like predicted nuclease
MIGRPSALEMSAIFRWETSIALVTLLEGDVISANQVDNVSLESMQEIITRKIAGQLMQQQAVSKAKQVRHLQACLWVYGNLLMPQSLLSDPVFLEKSKEVLHDFFKVWILRLRCFTTRAYRSAINVDHEDFGQDIKCGATARQNAVVAAEHLLDTIQAMSDILKIVTVTTDQRLRLMTESDGPLH